SSFWSRRTYSHYFQPYSSAWPFTYTTKRRIRGMNLHFLGAAIGLGMVVIGAGLGIGRFASAAAEGIARQPAAADRITGAVNLPLFLLEGVAIIAEVVILLIVLLK